MEEAPFLELLNDAGRREEAAREQGKKREKFSHVLNRTPAQANFLFGLSIEEQVMQQLEKEPFDSLRNRLAESYALQARFQDADETAMDEEAQAKKYARKDRAVKNPGKLCQCPDNLVTPSKVNAKGNREPMRHPIEKVFDGEKTYTLFLCRNCQTISSEIGG